MCISLAFVVLCLVCCEIPAPQLCALFIDNGTTIEYSAAFLRIVVVALPMMSVCYPMIILFLMDAILPLYGCMFVQPIVNTVSLMAAACFSRAIDQSRSKNREKNRAA